MKFMAKVKDACFCPFCKTKRFFYRKQHIDFTDVLTVGAFAATLSFGLFGWGDPSMIGFFGVGLGVAEAFIYIRWRQSVTCSTCGFDAVLYQSAPDRARSKVTAFYEKKIADPRFLMSSSPYVAFHREVENRRKANDWVRARRKDEAGVTEAPAEAESNPPVVSGNRQPVAGKSPNP
jgi:hypothetical protein